MTDKTIQQFTDEELATAIASATRKPSDPVMSDDGFAKWSQRYSDLIRERDRRQRIVDNVGKREDLMEEMGEHSTMLKPEDVQDIVSANPKFKFGASKPPLHHLLNPACIEMAMSMAEGEKKYTPANWRIKTQPVLLSTYMAANLRHQLAIWSGQIYDPDYKGPGKLTHWARMMSNNMIMLDAFHNGTLIDDRPTLPTYWEDLMKSFIKEMEDDRPEAD